MKRILLLGFLAIVQSSYLIAESSVRQWHTLTLSFVGPELAESTESNPFTDIRLLVTFRQGDAEYQVRGFFAADGNAAETGATSGHVWQVRFSPDRPGIWTYEASLQQGKDLAIADRAQQGDPIEIRNAKGRFTVEAVSETSEDFRSRGRLVAVGRYLRFGESGAYWLKGGADSPENLLAFADFDGTSRLAVESSEGEAAASSELHEYAKHRRDWRDGDPTWQAGKGKGLIGAINYLASTGMNAVYFLTLNIGGDGKDVWPYAAPTELERFDCSKLDQWEIVFQHMQRRGILLHVVTQETENERMLDDGDVGRLRKIYYQELIARFAHHPALIWNLGEENGPADFSPHGQTTVQQKAMAAYLKANDPYNHPVVIHTHATKHGKEEIQTPLLGHPPLDGLSFQVDKTQRVRAEIIEWHNKASESGRPWLIGMDEIGMWHTGAVPDADDPTHDVLRRQVLWGSLMAGAYGVEWYFGAKFPHNDLTSEDWRERANLWKQTKLALDFFEKHLNYWDMWPADDLIKAGNATCFADPGHTYLVYVVPADSAQTVQLDLSDCDAGDQLSVSWFDPLNGGDLQSGAVAVVAGGAVAELGAPPEKLSDKDWVILVKPKR